jgi:DNA-binding NtrC family response regulator
MKTILIVDDEADALKHLSHAVERRGFTAVTSLTGREAVEKYSAVSPDVVLLDVLLPDIHGDEVLRQILKIDPSAEVYFVTGYDNIMTEEKALQLGAKGLYTKPLMMEQLRSGQFL